MKKTYIKGIDLATIKPGDKIWYKPFTNTDKEIRIEEGVVTHVEDPKVWADYGDGGHRYLYVEYDLVVSDSNFMYGTIKEEEEMQTDQNSNKHPQYEVIVHWANGGEIQYRSNNHEHWADYPYGYDMSPGWSNRQFRIKPKTKEIKYRVALMKDGSIKVFNEDIPLDDDCDFKQWLDPEWRYVSVEI